QPPAVRDEWLDDVWIAVDALEERLRLDDRLREVGFRNRDPETLRRLVLALLVDDEPRGGRGSGADRVSLAERVPVRAEKLRAIVARRNQNAGPRIATRDAEQVFHDPFFVFVDVRRYRDAAAVPRCQ